MRQVCVCIFCGKLTSIDFVGWFYSLIGKGKQAFLFSPSFHQDFLAENLVINKKRKRKTKLPFLLLNFTLFLLLLSKFQLLKGSGLACSGCDPGSQDFWAPGSLVGRKEEAVSNTVNS